MHERGEQLGDYRLLEVLGQGYSTQVYRAVSVEWSGEEVAIKQLLPHLARYDSLVAALINEARMGRHLAHPNIARVLQFARSGDTFFLVTEFVDGYTLAAILDRTDPPSPLPPRVVGEIGAQLCDGLAHAHAATGDDGEPLGIVHRDLKPSNVMVTRDGTVKIKDFGIAKATTNLFLSSLGTTKGTPAYMSPEQVAGQPIDGRSDLFSLASMLAESLTGKPAFWGTDVHGTMHSILRVEVRDTLDQVEQFAPAMVPLLYRAWQYDADDRYTSAEEMSRSMYAILGDLPGGVGLAEWLRKRDLGTSLVTRDPDSLPEESVVGLETTEDLSFDQDDPLSDEYETFEIE